MVGGPFPIPPLITITATSLNGGIGRNIANLSNALVKSGCRVDILVEDQPNRYEEMIHPSIGRKILKTTHGVSGITRMAGYLLTRKPDVLLTPVVRHTILALRARRMTGAAVKIFARVHNTYSVAYSGLSDRKLSTRIRKFQKYYPQCDGIIAVSKGVARDFSSFTSIPPSSIRTIYNPMVTEELLLSAAQPVNHPWFEKGQPPVVLSVGRLEKQKNIPLILEAFDLARNQISCRLVIAGDGTLKEDLERRASLSPYRDDICFLGYTTNPFPLMKNSALFILSSSWEGFGNVLVEALAVGTPVVSTDCPHGPREILENGKYGTLVPPDDAQALAQAMVHDLQDPRSPESLLDGTTRFKADTVASAYLRAFDIPPRDDSRVKIVVD